MTMHASVATVTESGAAVFSKDREYRYHLARRWGEGPTLLWIMLNPSTAGAFEDDPTIRRCIGFTQRDEKFGGLEVVNLFGLVATNPKELRDKIDPVGPRNRPFVDLTLGSVSYAVAAWGATIDKVPQARSERAYALARAAYHDVTVMDLGTTKDGHPKHPLYLPGDTKWRVV